MLLRQATINVSSSYDALVEVFECAGGFLKRLEIYHNSAVAVDERDNHKVLKIMVEVFSALALATEQIKNGRISQWILVLHMSQLNATQKNLR